MDNAADSYRRFLEGDDNGLCEIIDEYNRGLSLYINHIVNNKCIAEEIMQNTFVKLAIKKPKFKGKSTFKTWLFAIARNEAVDFLRKKPRLSDIPVDEDFEISDETDIENEYLKKEQKIKLHNSIKKLSEEYKQIIYLIFFEEFSVDEASKILNKSKHQTSDLVYRAKSALKIQLEKEGFVYEKL